MKYLCLGYGDRAKMDALPKEELKRILGKRVPWVEELDKFKGMVIHEALSWDVTTLRECNGEVLVTDGPFAGAKGQIGSFFVIEARDLNEAIRVASSHPSARTGEDLGWGIEIRPVGELTPG